MSDQASTNGFLRAGELARQVGVSTDTLRHYERKGLLKPRRAPNGYREYPVQAVARVRLVQGALALGFTLDDLARVFKVHDEGGAPCRQVLALATTKLAELEQRLREMTALRDNMRALLQGWEERLSTRADDEPARLLEDLAATNLAAVERRTLLCSPWQHNNPKRKERKK